MFKRKKIFIFGAGGLLGRIIFNKLSKRHLVYGSSHRKLNNKNIIKLDYVNIDKKHINLINSSDYIINCIGESKMNHKMVDTNFRVINNISKNLKKGKIKYFIHISTCGVYGNLKPNRVNEKLKPLPYTLYSKTKLQGENILFDNLEKKFTVIILRCSQIIGPEMKNTSIRKLYFYIRKNLFFFTNNKKSIYSFVFQDDIMKCLEKIIGKKKLNSNIFNLSNSIRYEDLVKKILLTFDKKKFIPNISPILIKLMIKFFEFFKINLPLNSNQLNSLMTKQIYVSSKIKKKLRIKSFININSKNIISLIND